MSGYTPLFSSLTTGTLCGRWPDIGLWCVVLSLADRHGIVDVTPQYIASVSGLPIDEVVAAMKRFCEPDAGSRTAAEEGRRLELLDPERREWGWRIVNHSAYRERARLEARSARDIESGKNAKRMRDRRKSHETTGDRRRPPLKPNQTKQNQTEEKIPPIPPPGGDLAAGLDLDAWNRWEGYRREIRKPLKAASLKAAQRQLASFGSDQSAVVEQSIASGWQGLFPLKSNGPSRSAAEPGPGWRPTENDEGSLFA